MEATCMKYQILFSEKKKEKKKKEKDITNLSSAELAQRVVKVKKQQYFSIISQYRVIL